MRRRTGLDADQARRQLLKERQNITPLELAIENHVAIRKNGLPRREHYRTNAVAGHNVDLCGSRLLCRMT
jgi:hypothetical protein